MDVVGPMQVTVSRISSVGELGEFIRYPLELYRDDPLFVPHLLGERKRFFGRSNPIFEFIDVAYFLARDARGRPAGRVTAHVNRRYNSLAGQKTGYFGFFECTRDLDTAAALMTAAEAWLRDRDMTLIEGPFNFSTNEECGFLARGFERPPVFMMPYNPPCYLDFMSRLGYAPVKDLLSYEYAHHGSIPDYLVRYSRRAQQRNGVTVRPIDMHRFEKEVEETFRVYNAAWEENWGFVPMTEDEFHYAAREFKPIIEPSLVLMAEKEGKIIGFSLSLPDYNILLKKMHGRLFPFGFLRFIFGRRSIRHLRVILLGVLREHRRRGIDILLYYQTFRNAIAKGYQSGDMSWILEDNVLMRRAMERMGAKVAKIHRIFGKAL